ncbi:MAG TPA: pilus assembly protein CpaE, partial [Caulifigura sp.]|nr:pilus assembly protein CpaE [Caulifigura sp.]
PISAISSGLSILRHPLEMAEMGVIHEVHVERIVNLLKISYTHLVLDLSKSLLPTDQMGLRMADVILLIAQLELSSLRNVVRLIHCLSAEEGLAEKVRVVINRQGADTVEEGISLKKAEEVIGKPIFWQVPNDPKSVIGARVAGAPLTKHAPKSRAQQSIFGLAQALYGKPTALPADGRGSKTGWGSFFGKR